MPTGNVRGYMNKTGEKMSPAIRKHFVFEMFDDKILIHSEHGTRTVRREKDKYIYDCDFYKENGTCREQIVIIY